VSGSVFEIKPIKTGREPEGGFRHSRCQFISNLQESTNEIWPHEIEAIKSICPWKRWNEISPIGFLEISHHSSRKRRTVVDLEIGEKVNGA
jgi:hypothetical protein